AADGKPKREKAEMMRLPPSAAGKKETSEAADPRDQVAVGGQVRNAEGAPLANAHVAVVAAMKMPEGGFSIYFGALLPESEVLGLGKTDGAGRYQVHVPKKALQRAYAVEV